MTLAHAVPVANARAFDERGSLVFSLWVGLLLALALPPIWLVLALTPAGAATHRGVRRFARAVLGLSGCRLQVYGLEHLTKDPCAVLVANHSSYLDSVVLVAAIPRDCRFVANHLAATRPLIGLIIRKAGHLVVDRGSRRSRAACARAMMELLRDGTSLLLFPEGTRGGSEILPFHTGAFRAAVKTGLPVIPIAISGTRRIWPRRIRLLRRNAIVVRVLPAIHADAQTRDSAARLRDAAAGVIADAL
jgi:1-acyl-sn-glycerol-3-phosphate acyltransferase